MVRWFCDLCGEEIQGPETPTYISASRCRKGRNHPEDGWSGSDRILEIWCHAKCADKIVQELRATVTSAMRRKL